MPAVITITIREEKDKKGMQIRNDSILFSDTLNEQMVTKVLEAVVDHLIRGILPEAQKEGGPHEP